MPAPMHKEFSLNNIESYLHHIGKRGLSLLGRARLARNQRIRNGADA